MKTKLKNILASAVLGLVVCAVPAVSLAADKPYPLDTCIVSGNKLGSMGKPVTKVHEGQEIKFCCKPCIKKFDANPAKYMAKLK